MKECTIETYLCKRIKSLGGTAYKFVSPGRVGVPDRMVCLPGGRIVFVELKAPGRVSTPMQVRQQEQLRALGCTVYPNVDSKETIDLLFPMTLEDVIRGAFHTA